MKRVVLIGVAAAGLVALLAVAAIALVLLVTPVRAQIAGTINRVVNAQPVLSLQLQTTPATGQGIQLKEEKGILVGGVIVDSPADKAGLARGDIILSIDGQAVNTIQDLSGILTNHKAGDSLELSVQHGDAQKTVNVTLAEPPAGAQGAPQPQDNNRPFYKGQFSNLPFLGILPIGTGNLRIEKMELGQPGAVITQVAAGSPAEKASLKAGEIITAVDGTQIDRKNDLSTLLASHKPGDAVKLQVMASDGSSREVSVTLGDNPQKAGTAYLGVSVAGRMGMRGFGNGFPMPKFKQNLAGHTGALVEQVTQGSPAEKAGLKQGVLIESVDGKKIDSEQALTTIISGQKPGDTVTISVFDPQANTTSDVKLTLGDNPQKAGAAWMGITYGFINTQNLPARPNGLPTPNTSGTQF